jgi:hypothetical protein
MKARWWITGLVVAFLLALLSPIASKFPDGLERVAEDHGFIEKAAEAPFQVIPDYTFPGIENEAIATIIAGVLGTILVTGLGFGLAYILKSKHEA